MNGLGRRDTNDPFLVGLESFEAFYRREYPGAVRLAAVLSGSRLGAEDLAQEAFIEAHRRWEEIGRYRRPGAWIRRVVANRSVSQYRRRKAEARALLKLATGSQKPIPEFDPDTQEVWEAVRKLSTRQAQVIVLKYLEGMTLQEIAEVLEITVPTVGTHLQRGRHELSRRLGLMVGASA